MGVGTVHHIAWRSENEGEQAEWQHELRQKGFATSNLMDRQYFSSIYFREKGAILFEMATDIPGFTRDEPFESLGEKLLLPPWLEPHRKQIEQALPSVQVGGREKNQK